MEGETAARGPTTTPFAEIIQALAGLHQQHQAALLKMEEQQERRLDALLQEQRAAREQFRSWVDQGVRLPASAPTLHKMGPLDDPEAFLDLFERSAEAGKWPEADWPTRLIPLLSGEAQLAAQQLPVSSLLVYKDLKRAILQRVGRSPEQSRQRFRSLELGEAGRPFVFAQQLRDACRKWLVAEGRDVEGVIELVVLEQFIVKLPKRTAQWVQCHRPTSLDQAITLAEDQLVACPGVGEPLPTSLSRPSPSLSRPIPAPRSRGGIPPRPAPRWRTGPTIEPVPAPRAPPRGGIPAGSSSPSPGPALSTRQSLDPPPAAGVAGKPGPACWRCGDPGHFIDRCPVMEVDTLIRVPYAPQAAPDQTGLYQIP